MRHVKLLAAAGLIGITAVACTDDGYYGDRTYYGSSYRTQYVYGPGYSYSYGYPASSSYSWRADRDRDGVPNWRDRAPDNGWYR